MLYVFELRARTGRTDERTDGQDAYCGLLELPHNDSPITQKVQGAVIATNQLHELTSFV